MVDKIIYALFFLAALALAAQVAAYLIIAVLVAGLIFRTKETIGFLLLSGVLALFTAHPVLGLGALAVIGIVAFVRNGRKNPIPTDMELRLPEAEDGQDPT